MLQPGLLQLFPEPTGSILSHPKELNSKGKLLCSPLSPDLTGQAPRQSSDEGQ